jgi:hypothetical protein
VVEEIRDRHEYEGWNYARISTHYSMSVNTIKKLCTYERRGQRAERWKRILLGSPNFEVGLPPGMEDKGVNITLRECSICKVRFRGDRNYCSDRCARIAIRREDEVNKGIGAHRLFASGGPEGKCACGKVAFRKVDGRFFCAGHASEAVAAQAAAADRQAAIVASRYKRRSKAAFASAVLGGGMSESLDP